MRRKKLSNSEIGLLPYIREDIYSITTQSAQISGWEIKRFNIEQYWNKTQGEGVVVAVIDTGCDIQHEDLKENILIGRNFINANSAPNDLSGHGTHVASTIAASNNGHGMVGVAPKTKIIPIKSLDDNGSGSVYTVSDGVRWAADQKVDFITMSLGSPMHSPIIYSSIEYAIKKGCIVFCAAGNSGSQQDIMYPAKYENTIAIGAIDENLNRTQFTCSGDSLDFLAPGNNILGCVPNNQYALMSGTSMSNPFAVGCASLLLAYYRKYNKTIPKTNKDYIDILKNVSISLSDSRYNSKKYQGYGIINIQGLI
jgi:subtilisin family serine protease